MVDVISVCIVHKNLNYIRFEVTNLLTADKTLDIYNSISLVVSSQPFVQDDLGWNLVQSTWWQYWNAKACMKSIQQNYMIDSIECSGEM